MGSEADFAGHCGSLSGGSIEEDALSIVGLGPEGEPPAADPQRVQPNPPAPNSQIPVVEDHGRRIERHAEEDMDLDPQVQLHPELHGAVEQQRAMLGQGVSQSLSANLGQREETAFTVRGLPDLPAERQHLHVQLVLPTVQNDSDPETFSD